MAASLLALGLGLALSLALPLALAAVGVIGALRCLSWASERLSGLLENDLSTVKMASNSNVRLKNAQTAAKSLRTP